jgi:hypothetical protein
MVKTFGLGVLDLSQAQAQTFFHLESILQSLKK